MFRPALLCVAVALVTVVCGCGKHARASRKVIVLGVDGMDPGFVERHWDALPNLRRLRQTGSFHRLETTTPPQSPVAWSTFITGLDPDSHGIFDFVHRDPAEMRPFSSMSKTEPSRFELPLGPYVFPLAAPRVVSLRRGSAFWEALVNLGVDVTIVHMPTNYPPVESGRNLAGMGVPDVEGTQGTFSFYTSSPEELDRDVAGGHIRKVELVNGHADLKLAGPPNSLRRDARTAFATIALDVDADQPLARLSSATQAIILSRGEWSSWIPIEFQLLRHMVSVRGMVRAYLRQVHPTLELYFTPVNIDPFDPALPISQPKRFSRDLAARVGPFFTLGIPEDTSALRQGVFELPEFLSQTRLVAEDERTLLKDALRNYTDGLLFFYFSTVDQNSHMLWSQHEAALLDVYRAVDANVGEVMRTEPDADIVVMSDHGFTTFDRAVNLNTWLYERGFLALPSGPGENATISDADWSATEAYALGLNGLYVNLVGREKNGFVQRGDRSAALLATLREQLLAFRDPVTGKQVVATVASTAPTPQNAPVAPDLIVGYAPGYRASWQTGLGGVPSSALEDNNDLWIGDHCVSAAEVPGVLFTSRPAANPHPRLQDVTTSILGIFGAVQPKSGTTRSIF